MITSLKFYLSLFCFFIFLSFSFSQSRSEIIRQLDSELQKFDRYKNTYTASPPTPPNAPLCDSDNNCNSSSNDGNIKITYFNPIVSIKEGQPDLKSPSPPTAMAASNNQHLSTTKNGKEYLITHFQEHKTIPAKQLSGVDQNQFFEFEFSVEYSGNKDRLYYIILYQNESYKYPEIIYDSTAFPSFQGMLFKSGENFYGSWGYENTYGLKSLAVNSISPGQKIKDHFRITSSPKNETNKTWLFRPRMGDYKFLLVVSDNPDFRQLEFLVDPSAKFMNNSKIVYLSPFYWRNLIGSAMTEHTAVAESSYSLKLKAQINGCESIDASPEKTGCPFTKRTNSSSENNVTFDVIPQFSKLDDFTQWDYNRGVSTVHRRFLNKVTVDIGREDNVEIDPTTQDILLINRASELKPNGEVIARRDHAGIEYIQQTYGKFSAKIEFPKMYTRHHIWKGITNTFWAGSEGFSEFYNSCADPQPAGIPNRFEHDFEFFAMNNCTGAQDCYDADKEYDQQWRARARPKPDAKVKLRISNFDYACSNQVDSFVPLNGSADVVCPYNGKIYTLCRNCLPGDKGTGKSLFVEYTGDEALEDSLYFDDGPDVVTVDYSIEWTPTELVFRINDEILAYFNSQYTRISNFPMRFIVAQHMFNGINPKPKPWVFHHFQFIPLWTDPIVGRVTEFTIE